MADNGGTLLRLVDDNPAAQDALGFDRMLEILHAVLTHPPRLPLTVGLFGEWGSGKTTVMRLVQEDLAASGVRTIWFNAWKYDSKELIWNALIQSIFLAMQQDPSVPRESELGRRVAHFSAELGKYAVKVGVRLLPGGLARPEDVDELLAALSSSANDEMFAFVNRFEPAFSDLVEEYVGEGRHMVVFIDDLDRCMPENAITVLEALKLYLDDARCVFMVAAERAVIEAGIKWRYRDHPALSPRDYVEKIVQIPFVMPRADARRVLALVEQYDDQFGWRTDGALAELIVLGTGRNPRRVKRFVNAFAVLTAILGPLSRDQRCALSKLLLIQLRYPQLYDAMALEPRVLDRLTRAVQKGDEAIAQLAADSGANVGALLEDRELRRFLATTAAIQVEDEEAANWIQLAGAQLETRPA